MGRAEEIAREIRESDVWNPDLCRELCKLAGLAGEWEQADGENFENVVEAAAEKLGVDIH